VVADVPVAGSPDDGTIQLRYDPLHPEHAHASNGVLVNEIMSGFFVVLLLGVGVGLVVDIDLRPRPRPLDLPGSAAEPVSHVRVVS
jgi:hypothetical protein